MKPGTCLLTWTTPHQLLQGTGAQLHKPYIGHTGCIKCPAGESCCTASVHTSRTVGSTLSYRSALATLMQRSLVYCPNQYQTPHEMKKFRMPRVEQYSSTYKAKLWPDHGVHATLHSSRPGTCAAGDSRCKAATHLSRLTRRNLTQLNLTPKPYCCVPPSCAPVTNCR